MDPAILPPPKPAKADARGVTDIINQILAAETIRATVS